MPEETEMPPITIRENDRHGIDLDFGGASPTVKAKAAERTFTAPEGTELATTTGDGERLEITFPYTTSDEAVIETLAALANDPDHPVQEG